MSAALQPREPAEAPDHSAPRELIPLLRELGDLKRVTSAGRTGSIATRLFEAAWGGLVSGRPARDVALQTSAAALVAARLGDLDRHTMLALGLSSEDARRVLEAALDDVAGPVSEPLRAALRGALGAGVADADRAPPFVAALAAQPRAGVTCPGRARIVLQPAENHAEHCLMVAVYGVLLCPAYGADAATVFVAGLAHHLHNAALPDSGFTGEMLLGAHLAPVMAAATGSALAELAPDVRARVEAARLVLSDASTPEGRAFHAADVIDRVLEIDQHLHAASLTMHTVLGDMALVHDGPVKAFHDGVLAEMGLP